MDNEVRMVGIWLLLWLRPYQLRLFAFQLGDILDFSSMRCKRNDICMVSRLEVVGIFSLGGGGGAVLVDGGDGGDGGDGVDVVDGGDDLYVVVPCNCLLCRLPISDGKKTILINSLVKC